jgi:hypothetical protein
MKKITLISFLIICSFYNSIAQIDVGIKGGINVAAVKDLPDAASNNLLLSFNTGALAQFFLDKKFSIMSEILYSVKGFKTSGIFLEGNETETLNYFSIPILAGYKLNNDFTIHLGPELDFFNKGKLKNNSGTNDITPYFSKFDVGADIGLSCFIGSGIGAEIRYNYGLKKIANTVVTDYSGNTIAIYKEGGNRVFQAGLYYIIHVKKSHK